MPKEEGKRWLQARMLSSTGSKGGHQVCKILFFKYLFSLLFPGNSQIHFVFFISRSSMIKAEWPLLLKVLVLSCTTGCIQNDKYVKAYVEVPLTQDKALKEQASDGNTDLDG